MKRYNKGIWIKLSNNEICEKSSLKSKKSISIQATRMTLNLNKWLDPSGDCWSLLKCLQNQNCPPRWDTHEWMNELYNFKQKKETLKIVSKLSIEKLLYKHKSILV